MLTNSVQDTIGRSVYESWPTGATRQIEQLEIKLLETSRFMTGQVSEVVSWIERYRPSKEVLETDGEQRKIWKEVDQLKMAIKNRARHISPRREQE